eukprot:TRINITY_DN780064_c0_g1_i1.p1 TRINITY_DN780064_c0_g1~~TRINITY_DN780064_c0_g1_i1.p1  ORF type:complete len:489 (+),score=135.33 TRINITY_DN780064_c0_g1_i1:138-1604(+)
MEKFLTVTSKKTVDLCSSKDAMRRKMFSITDLMGITTIKNRSALTISVKKSNWKKKEFNRTPKVFLASPELISICSRILSVRRYLTIVNPMSGSGKGKKLYRKVLRYLSASSVEMIPFFTERANHARDEILKYDLEELKGFDGIVCVGGDGILYETINGIMGRPDYRKVLDSVSVSILPAGGGNGTYHSLCYEHDAGKSCLEITQALIFGMTETMNITAIDTGTHLSFQILSTAFGMLADVDKDSNRFKILGSSRFIPAAIGCILKRRKYACTLSVAGPDEYPCVLSEITDIDETTPELTARDLADYEAYLHNAPHIRKLVQLPNFTSEVPDSWRTFDMTEHLENPSSRNFCNTICITGISKIAYDTINQSKAKMNDGLLHYTIAKGMKRGGLVRSFLSLETPNDQRKGVNRRYLGKEWIEGSTTAFRLEGTTDRTLFIDGETIGNVQHIQGQILDVGLKMVVPAFSKKSEQIFANDSIFEGDYPNAV